MSVLSGLSARARPRSAASARTCGLGRIAQREDRVRQLLGPQRAEHVRLVLGEVDAAAQHRAVGRLRQPGVVAGDDGVEIQRQRALEHGGELDPLVAAQARVGGLAAGVGIDEVGDDVFGEALGQIPYVEGDFEHIGGAAGIARVVERAAAARTLAGGRGLA